MLFGLLVGIAALASVVCHAAQLAFELCGVALLYQGSSRHQLHLEVFQLLGILLVVVHLNEFLHTLCRDGIQLTLTLVGVPHNAAEDISFLIQGQTFLETDRRVGGRELLQGVGVDFAFEIKATFQFATLSCQLLRIGKDLLGFGGTGRHRLEIGQPGAAAEFPATGPQAAHFAGLLAHTNLFHLDAYMELLRQHLDELTKVHPVFGRIVEDGFGVVALILHVVYLHLQIHLLGDLAGLQQGVLFALYALGPTFDVGTFGAPEEFLNILSFRVHMVFLHLYAAHFAREADYAYVMSGHAFHGHDVSFRHLQAIGQAVEVLSIVLETHLHTVKGGATGLPDAFHPVGGGHLAAAVGLHVANGFIGTWACPAASAEEYALVVFHPWQRGVGVEVGVDGVLWCHKFAKDIGLVVFPLLLLLAFFFAAVADKSFHLLSSGHIVVVTHVGGGLHRGGLLLRHILLFKGFFGLCLLQIFLLFHSILFCV